MKKLAAIFLVLYATTTMAVLEVTVLKQDEDTFPIVISPFSVQGNAKQGRAIANIMRDNFNRSGEFSASSANHIINSQIDFNQWRTKKSRPL